MTHSQPTLIDVKPVAPARPTFDMAAVNRLKRQVQNLYDELADLRYDAARLEDQIDRKESEIDRLMAGHEWPDRHTLLMVYGAPGNWPVEPA